MLYSHELLFFVPEHGACIRELRIVVRECLSQSRERKQTILERIVLSRELTSSVHERRSCVHEQYIFVHERTKFVREL